MGGQSFHINNEGNVGKCSAVFKCPFGDLELDHYSSKEDAEKAQEERNQERLVEKGLSKVPKNRLQKNPIIREPSKLKTGLADPTYSVEYDYDSYECSTDDCGEDGDYCRDRVYEGLRVTGWDEPDGLAAYARRYLGMSQNEEFPEDLKKRLSPHVNTVLDDFEIYGDAGYYGEEIAVEAPDYLNKTLDEYVWSQPNAVDDNKVLPYLRGKGFETQGLAPLEAIKEHLKAENKGRISKTVQSAQRFKVSNISLRNVQKGSKSQEAASRKNPKEPKPVPDSGNNEKIAGVVTYDGEKYKLVDGYHRTAFLDAQNSSGRKKGKYVILDVRKRLPWDYSERNSWSS